MHISDIYFVLLTLSYKLHIQRANILRDHFCEKTAVLSKEANFLIASKSFVMKLITAGLICVKILSLLEGQCVITPLSMRHLSYSYVWV